jgi:hypothetical protein
MNQVNLVIEDIKQKPFRNIERLNKEKAKFRRMSKKARKQQTKSGIQENRDIGETIFASELAKSMASHPITPKEGNLKKRVRSSAHTTIAPAKHVEFATKVSQPSQPSVTVETVEGEGDRLLSGQSDCMPTEPAENSNAEGPTEL